MVSIKNNGNQSVTYSFGSVNAATAYALSSVGSDIAQFPPLLDPASPISVSLSASSVTVKPGITVNITATFSINETFDQSLIPVYSGYIIVNSSAPSDYGNLNIPFMGVGANLSTQDVLDTTAGFPSVTPSGTSATPPGIAPNGSITSSTITSFDMSNANDTPVFNYALRFPSRRVRLDLLPADPSAPVNSTFAGLGILGYVSDIGGYAYISETLLINHLFQGVTVPQIWTRTISIRYSGVVISVTVHSHQMVNTALLHGFSDGWLKTSMTRQIGILSSLLFSVFRIPIHQAIRRLHDEVTGRVDARMKTGIQWL